jgi:membrane-associated phospholipid phosphatase
MKVMPLIVVAYIGVFALTFFLLNLRLSVEWVAIALCGAAALTLKFKTFLKDWGVFIAAVVAWQVTDGLALRFNFPWHVQDMVTADRWIFQPVLHGQLPTIWLQQQLFRDHVLSWIDVLSVVVYSLHFLLPLGAGFILWLVNRQLYYRYAVCFVLAAVLGFVTYIVYPAVPPWMAANYASHCVGNLACWKVPGNPAPVIPWVYNGWSHAMQQWLTTSQGNVGFGPFTLGYDQVGAMPSEHVMYPTLVFLFFRRQFGKIGYLMVPYTLLVVFAIVYMGQHYFIDAVVGAAYAVAVYAGVMKLAPWVSGFIRSQEFTNPFAYRPRVTNGPYREDLAAFERAETAS